MMLYDMICYAWGVDKFWSDVSKTLSGRPGKFKGCTIRAKTMFDHLCRQLNVPALGPHIYQYLIATMFYQCLFLLSPVVFRKSKSYRGLNKRTAINWDIHFVSFLQAFIIMVLSLPITWDETLRRDRVFGYTKYGGLVYATAMGYFSWDVYVSTRYISYFGLGFALHAVASLVTFTFSFRPFLMYYGPAFLVFELSTPFLNINWFMDKMGMASHPSQTVNGVLLVFTFFVSRIVWGWYAIIHVGLDCWSTRANIPVS